MIPSSQLLMGGGLSCLSWLILHRNLHPGLTYLPWKPIWMVGREQQKKTRGSFLVFPARRPHYYSSSPLSAAHLPFSKWLNFFTLHLSSPWVRTVCGTNSFFFFLLSFSTASLLSLVRPFPRPPPLLHPSFPVLIPSPLQPCLFITGCFHQTHYNQRAPLCHSTYSCFKPPLLPVITWNSVVEETAARGKEETAALTAPCVCHWIIWICCNTFGRCGLVKPVLQQWVGVLVWYS